MTILDQYTDAASKIRILVLLTDGTTVWWKFTSTPTTPELEALETAYIAEHLYDDEKIFEYQIMDNLPLLKEVVDLIHDNPSITLSQFNTYLGTKTWYESATIQYFTYMIAEGLSVYHGVSLGDLTVGTILANVRDWIAANPTKKIARILFGE